MAEVKKGKKKRIIQKEVYVSDIFVSVVVVLRNDTDIDPVEYYRELGDMLYRRYSNYEVIIVDNGIDFKHLAPITALLAELPCFRILRLSRTYSHDTAVMAGLEGSIGDYTVVTDPSLDQLKDIPNIVDLNMKHDIVQGIAKLRKSDKNAKNSLGRRVFYWYSRKYMNIDVPTNSTYLLALSRRAVKALTTTSRHDSHIRHMLRVIGYSYAVYAYETRTSPIRNRSLKVGAMEALNVVSSHSSHPLRFMSWIGFFASVLNIFYALYVLVVALTSSHVAEGWTTMSLQISGMFFILFLFMIVLAEYIGKILVEARQDSRYHVLDELSSTVSLADLDRKNITS